MGVNVGNEEFVLDSFYLMFGVSVLEKFEVIKGVYVRRCKDVEKWGDDVMVEWLDKVYDWIMMMQLLNWKQGLVFGGQFVVFKEIKYVDKWLWIFWGLKKVFLEKCEVLINLVILVVFLVWIVVVGGQVEWKLFQFMIFGYIFCVFNKLKEYEFVVLSVFVSEEEEGEEGGGGSCDESNMWFKNGKWLFWILGLVFSCVVFVFFVYMGILNVFEFVGQYIFRILMGVQEFFVMGVIVVCFFIMVFFFR